MTSFKKQIVSVFASAAVILNTAVPVFAGTTLEISGNGSGSNNTASINLSSNTSVVQNNTANVVNEINASADSGDNKAKDNTGGNVSIDTGNATTNVSVSNALNSNAANVDCCVDGNTTVKITGNGSDTNNTANLNLTSDTGVWQDNYAKVRNEVDADAETGENTAKDNTGGDVSIETGNAKTGVSIATAANANTAMVGGGNGNGGGNVDLLIAGNGSESDNLIALDLYKNLSLAQDNDANVKNEVDADAETGENLAKDNTGGDSMIDTGNASTDVSVDNAVNFNFASTDCGCLLDILAKIAGNASDSDNLIAAELDDNLDVHQDNQCGAGYHHESIFSLFSEYGGYGKKCETDVDAEAETGENVVKDSTSDVHGDPAVETGNADTNVEVGNEGNVNVYGAELPEDWPDFDFNLNLSLSLEQLMALLGNIL